MLGRTSDVESLDGNLNGASREVEGEGGERSVDIA